MYLTVETGKTIEEQGMAALVESERTVAQAREDFISLLPLFARLEALPSWGHVGVVSTFGEYVTLALSRDHKASPLPREIAQEFHATGHKEPGEDTLSVRFELPRVNLVVSGYLPATCRIEYVDEYIPAHHGRVAKVVCTGGDSDPS